LERETSRQDYRIKEGEEDKQDIAVIFPAGAGKITTTVLLIKRMKTIF
jgi:hypothetical protein